MSPVNQKCCQVSVLVRRSVTAGGRSLLLLFPLSIVRLGLADLLFCRDPVGRRFLERLVATDVICEELIGMWLAQTHLFFSPLNSLISSYTARRIPPNMPGLSTLSLCGFEAGAELNISHSVPGSFLLSVIEVGLLRRLCLRIRV